MHLSDEELIQQCMEAMPVPERGQDYGNEVWERIESRLVPGRSRRAPCSFPGSGPRQPDSLLLVVAFLAGRFFPWTPRLQPTIADSQVRERVLRTAVADYLERSQGVLVELANASPKGSLDITAEQARAADLVMENRLYRQTAARAGDAALAGVLEELELVLLEIAHAPSQISPSELETLARARIQGILFKIRVLGSNVGNYEERPGIIR